jgi:hypothetical protein
MKMLLLALVLAVLGGALPASAAERPRVVPATLEIVGLTNAGAAVTASQFSLATLRDLRIIAWWNVGGAHVQRLELRAPDGSLYQRLTRPFDTRTAVPQKRGVHKAGAPVTTLLPVGGTWITEYSLVGSWQINLYLDNSRTPVASKSFQLTP